MAETRIGDNHRDYLAKVQHVGEWLQQEQQRAAAELQLIMQQSQRHAAEFTAFLQRTYGLDAAHTPVTLDVERGVLITPDETPDPLQQNRQWVSQERADGVPVVMPSGDAPDNVTPFASRAEATPAPDDAPPAN